MFASLDPVDPDEIVVLGNHGVMRLRSAVARAMLLPREERHAAIIVRKGKLSSQSILSFEDIKQLATRWAQTEQPAFSEASSHFVDGRELGVQPSDSLVYDQEAVGLVKRVG